MKNTFVIIFSFVCFAFPQNISINGICAISTSSKTFGVRRYVPTYGFGIDVSKHLNRIEPYCCLNAGLYDDAMFYKGSFGLQCGHFNKVGAGIGLVNYSEYLRQTDFSFKEKRKWQPSIFIKYMHIFLERLPVGIEIAPSKGPIYHLFLGYLILADN